DALVRSKIEGGQVALPQAEEEDGGEVVDLLAALAKSVDKAKKSRGERTSCSSQESGSTPSSTKTPPKRASAKKSAAKTSASTKSGTKKESTKKSGAKKSAAKKSTAKKSTAKKKAS